VVLTVGEGIVGLTRVFVSLADFLVGTHRYLPCPAGGWWHFSPHTVTCPKKNAARSRGFEPTP